jgi:hypothetical protein
MSAEKVSDITEYLIKHKLSYRFDDVEPIAKARRNEARARLSLLIRNRDAALFVNELGDPRSLVATINFARADAAGEFLDAHPFVRAPSMELQGSYCIMPEGKARLVPRHVTRLYGIDRDLLCTGSLLSELSARGKLHSLMYHRDKEGAAFATYVKSSGAEGLLSEAGAHGGFVWMRGVRVRVVGSGGGSVAPGHARRDSARAPDAVADAAKPPVVTPVITLEESSPPPRDADAFDEECRLLGRALVLALNS